MRQSRRGLDNARPGIRRPDRATTAEGSSGESLPVDRVARLTRARIISAALARADRHGLEKLSMRALAGDLGVEAMSLYHHVRNKDDLLDGLVEAVLSEVTPPCPQGEWRAEMRRRALTLHAAFRAHPWAPPLVCGRINLGPRMLGLIDATLGCLRAAGFSYPQADRIWNALDAQVYGFHLLDRLFPIPPDGYRAAAQTYLPFIDAARLPHMHLLSVMVAQGTHDGISDLCFGLDRLLDALDRLPREGDGDEISAATVVAPTGQDRA